MLVGLEGWFDVASVATQAVNAFISADHAVTVGSIDPDPFYDFTQQRPQVSIDDDVREIVWPNQRVRAATEPRPPRTLLGSSASSPTSIGRPTSKRS